MKKVAIVAVIISLYFLSRITQGLIDYEMAGIFFSSSTFLFGIFIAFYISNAHGRINTVFETLNKHNADLLYLYSSAQALGDDVQKKMQKLIDNYLIQQLDYELKDFKYSYNEYQLLFRYAHSLFFSKENEKKIAESYIQKHSDLIHQRKKIEVSLRSKLLSFDWLVLYMLSVFVIFFIYYLSDTSFFSLISSSALVFIVTMLIVLLQNLNNLTWKERYRIWRPLHQLFLELDLVPYYPDEVLKRKRTYLRSGETIRIAHYPNIYPDMRGKTIETVVWK